MQRSKTIRLRHAGLLLLLITIPQAGAQTPTLAGLTDNWFVTSDSVRLHYLSGGSGPTMVFVPGWTMPADIWEPQLRYFVRSHRVIALDPRSQGASERVSEGNFVRRHAQDVHELLHHLGTGAPLCVAWTARCCASAPGSCARRLIPCAHAFRIRRSRSSSTLVTLSSLTSRSASIERWNSLFNGFPRARLGCSSLPCWHYARSLSAIRQAAPNPGMSARAKEAPMRRLALTIVWLALGCSEANPT